MMQPHDEAMPVGFNEPVNQASYEGAAADVGAYGPEACVDGQCGHASYVPTCHACRQCRGACGNCSPWPNCADGHRAVADQLGGPPGPPCGQITYPYYTTRGPRDFLMKNPRPIGP